MARCKIVVSSKGAGCEPFTEDVLARGPSSDVSRKDLDMAAVLPLRRASTIRNLRTDCSRVVPFSAAEGLDRVGAKELGSLDGIRPSDILEAWPFTEF